MTVHYRQKFGWDLEIIVFDDLSIAIFRHGAWRVEVDGEAATFVSALRKTPPQKTTNY